jgi:sec-independent protein translocase protein TatA
MKIFGMGLPELIIILVVVLIIFGPKTLPKLGSAMGKTVRNLREGMGRSKKGDKADDAGVSEEASDEEASDEDEAEAEDEKPAEKKPAKKASKKPSKSE